MGPTYTLFQEYTSLQDIIVIQKFKKNWNHYIFLFVSYCGSPLSLNANFSYTVSYSFLIVLAKQQEHITPITYKNKKKMRTCDTQTKRANIKTV